MGGAILVVSPWSSLWSLAPGAGVADEAHLLAGLVARGYAVHMLVPRGPQIMTPGPGITVHTLPNVLGIPGWLPAPLRRAWLLPAFWSLAAARATRLARELRPRLLLGFSHYGAYPACRAARAIGAPSVLKLFGVMQAMRLEWSLPRYLYHNLEAVLAFKQPLDHFILLNDGTWGERVARRWGVPPERISWLPNGVNKEWAQLELERGAVRQRFGASAGSCVALALSRLVASKRVDRAVDAVATAARSARTPLELWIAGAGPLRPRLEARCRSQGIACRFLGSVPHREVPQVLAAADFLLATSELTNMSIPTCEAMVMGTPVVALDVAGTGEVVRDGITGRLVAENDPPALAAAVAALADDVELRRRLGEGAREFAARHFVTWDERVAAEIAVLEGLIESRSGVRPPESHPAGPAPLPPASRAASSAPLPPEPRP